MHDLLEMNADARNFAVSCISRRQLSTKDDFYLLEWRNHNRRWRDMHGLEGTLNSQRHARIGRPDNLSDNIWNFQASDRFVVHSTEQIAQFN